MCLYKYTDKDLKIIRDIIMGKRKPSVLDYIKYDVNLDGKITSMDYVIIKKRMGVSDK